MSNTVTIIAQEVSRATGVTVADILSERKDAKSVIARHMCFALAKEYTTHSLPKIARAFKRKDHTTVLWALRVWPAKAVNCEVYRMMADAKRGVEDRLAYPKQQRQAIAEARGLVAA